MLFSLSRAQGSTLLLSLLQTKKQSQGAGGYKIYSLLTLLVINAFNKLSLIH